jgi:hypothetical protein
MALALATAIALCGRVARIYELLATDAAIIGQTIGDD